MSAHARGIYRKIVKPFVIDPMMRQLIDYIAFRVSLPEDEDVIRDKYHDPERRTVVIKREEMIRDIGSDLSVMFPNREIWANNPESQALFCEVAESEKHSMNERIRKALDEFEKLTNIELRYLPEGYIHGKSQLLRPQAKRASTYRFPTEQEFIRGFDYAANRWQSLGRPKRYKLSPTAMTIFSTFRGSPGQQAVINNLMNSRD